MILLVSEALDLYLARPNLAANTRASYGHQIKHLILWVGDKDLDSLSQADLMRYIAFKQGQGRTSRTLNVITNIFKTLFRWLHKHGYMATNPALALDRLREEPIPDNVRAISLDEWVRLSVYARRTAPRDYAILAFLMDTACRISAGSMLMRDKLDLANCRAVVYEPKIKRWVEVGFSRSTAKALEEWLKLRPAVNNPYVFVSELKPHNVLDAGSIRMMMKKMCQKLGMPIRTPHSLRHAALQHLAKQPDVTLLDVQTKANHLSARTTLENYFPQRSERVFELSQKYSLVETETAPEFPQLRVLPKPAR